MGIDAPWVDDLVRWGQSKVKEAWNGNRWNTVSEGHSGANVVNTLKWVTRQVQVLLWTNDVNLFPVIESLADEWDIHETEKSDVAAIELLRTTESALSLPVECTLTKDRTK